MTRRVIAACTLSLLCAGPASASLVYRRVDAAPPVAKHDIVVARNDGSEPRVVAHGYGPSISPNGRRITYYVQSGRETFLYVVGVDGRHHRKLASRVSYTGGEAWSADSRYFVAPDTSAGAALVDLQDGSVRRVRLDGGLGSASFDPAGGRFAVDDAEFGDLYVVRLGVEGKRPLPDGSSPIWTRAGLTFSRDSRVFLKRRLDEPATTILDEAPATVGPVDWVAQSNRLLVMRVPPHSARHALVYDFDDQSVRRIPASFSWIRQLSNDGRHVLGERGPDVISVGLRGVTKVLAHNGADAAWTE